MQDDLTTLVCLFHHSDQAQAAIRDLRNARVPEDAISVIGGDGTGVDALDKSELGALGMPDRDYDHLKQGVAQGNVVVAVSALADHVATVEKIFAEHRAEKIDEADAEAPRFTSSEAVSPFSSEPIVPLSTREPLDSGVVSVVDEEELLTEERTANRGSVRLYRRSTDLAGDEVVAPFEEPGIDAPASKTTGPY